MPDAQAACGHILRHSGFQWEATENCSQELNFICQFGMHTYINQHITLNLVVLAPLIQVLIFFFFLPLRIWEIYRMRWPKRNTAMWFWSSYRDRRQLLWSKNNSLLPFQTHSLARIHTGGVQLDRCDGLCNRYYEFK